MFDNSKDYTSSQQMMEMDLNKVREIIAILEDHERICESENRYVEAGITKEKLFRFKKLEEQKMQIELDKKHEKERTEIEIEQSEELAILNQKYDFELNNINKDYEDAQRKLKSKHEKELQISIESLNRKLPEKPKPTPELLNLVKMLEGLGKQRE